jgi:hypothetical protein
VINTHRDLSTLRRKISKAEWYARTELRLLITEVVLELGAEATQIEVEAAVLKRLELRPDIKDAYLFALRGGIARRTNSRVNNVVQPSLNDHGVPMWKKSAL